MNDQELPMAAMDRPIVVDLQTRMIRPTYVGDARGWPYTVENLTQLEIQTAVKTAKGTPNWLGSRRKLPHGLLI